MLTALDSILARAERARYAIPAFNVTNLETAQAVINAATIARSPVIVQTSEAAIAYAGHRPLLTLIEELAAQAGRTIPVVTHLDHGKHYAIVERSIRMGYRSVHMDASELPWRQNVALTRRAVAAGHRHQIRVQGELGYLLGYEGMVNRTFSRRDLEKLMTDPDQAREFVRATGVDTLAVAIGTAHGSFVGKEHIDFDRLKSIRRLTSVPIVLHGGSGVPNAEIKKAIRLGIRIINVDTTLRLSFMGGLVSSLRRYDPKKKVDIRNYLGSGRLTMQQEAIKLMKLFGSAGKAH